MNHAPTLHGRLIIRTLRSITAHAVPPMCAMMPIAGLPPPGAMRAHHEAMKAQYTASQGHTIQIQCAEYSHRLYEEWDAGKRRT